VFCFFFQAEDGIRDFHVTGVQTCALPIFDALEERVNEALQKFPEDVRGSVPIIYTAHSLPEKIRENNDPYESDLNATFEAMKERSEERRVGKERRAGRAAGQ